MSAHAKSAWLITWQWMGEHAHVEDPVVAVLNYRLSSKTVLDIVERTYAAMAYSRAEKLALAIDRRANPKFLRHRHWNKLIL